MIYIIVHWLLGIGGGVHSTECHSGSCFVFCFSVFRLFSSFFLNHMVTNLLIKKCFCIVEECHCQRAEIEEKQVLKISNRYFSNILLEK